MMAASSWTPDEWEEWSNDLAEALPTRYDGDEAQEAIILDAVKDMAARLDQIRQMCLEHWSEWVLSPTDYRTRILEATGAPS